MALSGEGQKRLSGRRILVTGAASGMGRAVALKFAAEGAALVLFDVDGDRLKAVATETEALGIQADVASEVQVKIAVEQAARELGGLDGVVNVAGVLVRAQILDTDLAEWERVFAINLFGPLNVCRHVAPELLKTPGSTIVNFCSTASLRPFNHVPVYSASKAALLSLTRSLAMELAPTVRVNAVAPGPIRTPMNEAMWAIGSGPSAEAMGAGVGLKRLGEASELADAALYLTGPESSYVNGETLVVDGGHSYY